MHTAILHLPTRVIILTNKADKCIPILEQIPIEKYPHPRKKLVPPTYALSCFLIPFVQQEHYTVHLKRQQVYYRIDFTGVFLIMPCFLYVLFVNFRKMACF